VAFKLGGVTATVVVLVAFGIGTVVYALHLHPADTKTPQPSHLMGIALQFPPKHSTLSSIQIVEELAQEPYVNDTDATGASLYIELSGKDLTRPGWTLTVDMPKEEG
jgi:hypothetical protein